MKKLFVNMKRMVALLMGTAMFFACSLGDDPDRSLNPDLSLGSGMCSLEVSTVMSDETRAAFPTGLPEGTVYFARITMIDQSVDLTLTGTSTTAYYLEDTNPAGPSHRFLYKEHNYASSSASITIAACLPGTTSATVATNYIASGYAEFELPKQQISIVLPNAIKLSPMSSSAGTGTVSLKVKVPDGVTSLTVNNANFTVNLDSSTRIATISSEGINKGSYSLLFTAKDASGNIVELMNPIQTVNVYKGFATDTWYQNSATGTDTVELTASAASLTQVFVNGGASCTFYGSTGKPSVAGNDSNKGTIFSPLKTVTEAVSRLPATGGTIFVDGTTSDEKADGSTALEIDKDITIKDINSSLVLGGTPSGTIKIPLKVTGGKTLTLDKIWIAGKTNENLIGVNVSDGTLNIKTGTIIKNFPNGGALVESTSSLKINGTEVTTGTSSALDDIFSNNGFTSSAANTTPFDVCDKKNKYIRITTPSSDGTQASYQVKTGIQSIATLGNGSTLYLGRADAAADTEWAIGSQMNLTGGTAGQTYTVMPSSAAKKVKFTRKNSGANHSFVLSSAALSGTRVYKNLIIDGFVGSAGTGAYKANGGTHSFENCEFYGNKNSIGNGGAILVSSGTTVNLTGCTIGSSAKPNSSGLHGGAIHVDSTGTLKLLGTENNISYNIAGINPGLTEGRGGAVSVGSEATFIMEGGTISNNGIGNSAGNEANLVGKGGNIYVASGDTSFDFESGTVSNGSFWTGTTGTGNSSDLGFNIYNEGSLRLKQYSDVVVSTTSNAYNKYSVYSTKGIVNLSNYAINLDDSIFDGFTSGDGYDVYVRESNKVMMRMNKFTAGNAANNAILTLLGGPAGGSLYVGKSTDSNMIYGDTTKALSLTSSYGTAGSNYSVSLTKNVSTNKIKYKSLSAAHKGSLVLEGLYFNSITMNTTDSASVTLGSNSEVTGNTDSGVKLSKGTFILDGGNIHDNGGTGSTIRGGGINYTGGTLTLKKGKINRNDAYIGGGLYVDSAQINLTETGSSYIVYISENNSVSSGGGVYLTGTAKFTANASTNFYVESNTSGLHGGGFYVNSSNCELTLNSGFIQSNSCNATTGHGGGIYALADIALKDVVFSENSGTSGSATSKVGVGSDGMGTGNYSRGVYSNAIVNIWNKIPDTQDICLGNSGQIYPKKVTAGAYICPLTDFDMDKVYVSPTSSYFNAERYMVYSEYKPSPSGQTYTNYKINSSGKLEVTN